MDVVMGELVVKRKKCGEQQKRKPSLLSKTMVYLCPSLSWPQGIFRNAKTTALFILSITALGRGVSSGPSARLLVLSLHAPVVIRVLFGTK